MTVNTRDFRARGFRQVGGKRGKIGHALPGISIRIVDPETREPLPVGTPGLMLVRGPNVMRGYLGRPVETAKALDARQKAVGIREKGLLRAKNGEFLLVDGAGPFLNGYDLIGIDIEHHVDDSTGPENLQSLGSRRFAHTEMNARVVLRQIA